MTDFLSSGLPGECQAIAMEVLGASPSQGSSNFLSTDDATRVGWASFNSISAGLAGLALAGPVGSCFDASQTIPDLARSIAVLVPRRTWNFLLGLI